MPYGKECSIEVRAKVFYEHNDDSIISQYIMFSKVYTQQIKKYGYTRKAVLETICICRDRNILAEYLKNREREAITIMMALFDEEYIQRAYWKRVMNEAKEEVTQKVTQKVTEEVTQKVTEEVTQKVTEEVTQEVAQEVTRKMNEKAMANTIATAAKMLKSGRIKIDEIHNFFPQIDEENIKNLQQMLLN